MLNTRDNPARGTIYTSILIGLICMEIAGRSGTTSKALDTPTRAYDEDYITASREQS